MFPNHDGELHPSDADFFADPDLAIGTVFTAYTEARIGKRPRSVLLYVLPLVFAAIAFLAGASLANAVVSGRNREDAIVVTGVGAALVVTVASILFLRKRAFASEYCSYVGDAGAAEYRRRGDQIKQTLYVPFASVANVREKVIHVMPHGRVEAEWHFLSQDGRKLGSVYGMYWTRDRTGHPTYWFGKRAHEAWAEFRRRAGRIE
jgi:hypothetical protein